MSDIPTTSDGVEEFDGTADDVVMPDDVRAAAEARVAAAVAKYGDSTLADRSDSHRDGTGSTVSVDDAFTDDD